MSQIRNQIKDCLKEHCDGCDDVVGVIMKFVSKAAIIIEEYIQYGENATILRIESSEYNIKHYNTYGFYYNDQKEIIKKITKYMYIKLIRKQIFCIYEENKAIYESIAYYDIEKFKYLNIVIGEYTFTIY